MRWIPPSLDQALKGISAAYYMIHGLRGGKLNAERDLQAARNFTQAAERQGVDRIIYLGELVDPTANLSPYLRSRHETGYTLRQSHVPVTEFRAGMVIGAGSSLFEMIRYLAEREPLFICPAWFFSEAQPIAIRDVLEYLVTALKVVGQRRQADRDRGPNPPHLRRDAACLCKRTQPETPPHPDAVQCAASLGLLGPYGHAHPLAGGAAADRRLARPPYRP